MKKPLSCVEHYNPELNKRSLRTSLIIILIFILSFTVSAGSMLLKSLEPGITSAAEKMGAEIISIVGCLSGSLTAGILTFMFHNHIVNILQVPFLQPQFGGFLKPDTRCINAASRTFQALRLQVPLSL